MSERMMIDCIPTIDPKEVRGPQADCVDPHVVVLALGHAGETSHQLGSGGQAGIWSLWKANSQGFSFTSSRVLSM